MTARLVIWPLSVRSPGGSVTHEREKGGLVHSDPVLVRYGVPAAPNGARLSHKDARIVLVAIAVVAELTGKCGYVYTDPA
jgi:hypothetical protein